MFWNTFNLDDILDGLYEHHLYELKWPWSCPCEINGGDITWALWSAYGEPNYEDCKDMWE